MGEKKIMPKESQTQKSKLFHTNQSVHHNKKSTKLAYGSLTWIKYVYVHLGIMKAMCFLLTCCYYSFAWNFKEFESFLFIFLAWGQANVLFEGGDKHYILVLIAYLFSRFW